MLYSLGLSERLEQKMQPWSTEATPRYGGKSCRSMACPSWLRPGGSLGHLKARTRGQWMMQVFQPELLENILGPNPQNGVIRKFPAMTPPFPRDSRPAVCHATACVPPSCHEARPPWGETRDGDLPPPFPGGVESGIRPFSKGHSCGGEMCCFYQKKRRFKNFWHYEWEGNQKATRNIKQVQSLQFNRFQQHCYTDDLTNLSPIIFRNCFSKFIHLLKWLDLVITLQHNQPTTWGFW